MSTDTMTRPEQGTEQRTQTGGGEGHFSHIVFMPKSVTNMSPQAYVTENVFAGTPITALCGYVWVPSRDPKKYPVCSKCKDIWETTGSDLPDRQGNLPDA